MPTITSAARPQHTAQTEDSYRAPVKQILAASTGMVIDKPATTIGHPGISKEETSAPQAVTLSPQLAALARKEAKFRQQEQALKAEREALAAEKAAEQAKYSKLAGVQEKLTAKDYSALSELGVSYEEWTQYLLSKGESEKPETQAIKKLEGEIQSIKASQEEATKKQYDATIAKYKTDIGALIAKDPEFITIKEQKAEEHVLQHILDTFNEDGQVMTIEQASKEIEDFLVEEAMSAQNLTKIKQRALPPPEEPKKTLPPPKSGLRTLSNQIAPKTTGATSYPQFQHLSPKERIALAIQKAQKKD